MNEITIPDHLVIPALVSLMILLLFFFYRKSIYKSSRWKWSWISLTLFFTLYMLIVGGAAYMTISLELALNKFDLNADDNFSLNERTPEMQLAMDNVIRDNARNLSIITGFIFSGILAFITLLVGETFKYIKRKIHKLNIN